MYTYLLTIVLVPLFLTEVLNIIQGINKSNELKDQGEIIMTNNICSKIILFF